jgi:superfamily II DNA or RNA helicase
LQNDGPNPANKGGSTHAVAPHLDEIHKRLGFTMTIALEASNLSNLMIPEPGQLVTVRDRQWVVSDISKGSLPVDAVETEYREPHHLISLVSVEDDAIGEELRVIWEIEPGRRIIDHAALPVPDPKEFDDPERLEAFLDAIRWGAIASADPRYLQSPFRSGITIEDYQLDPVVRALRMPRVNLLIADDVGLGKTIEAGLVVQELLLRHRARTVLVVCPSSLCLKWKAEMQEKFGLEFRVVNTELLKHLRRTRGLYANPFTHFPRLIVSIDWLKRDRPMRLLKDILPATPQYPRTFDLLIVDEAHGVAPAGRGKWATDSQRTTTIRAIASHFEHRLFITATPHNGYKESFSALLELLDNQRFARGVQWKDEQLRNVMVRRLKSDLPGFPERRIEPIRVGYTDEERHVYAKLKEYGDLRMKVAAKDDNAGTAERFVHILLKRRLFSSPAAFGDTLAVHRETITKGKGERSRKPNIQVLRKAIDEVEADHGDEEELEQATFDAVDTAARVSLEPDDVQRKLLDEMQKWAERARGRSDAKADLLLDWLEGIVRPNDNWGDERVIIFTEYRATQRWLQERLAARGIASERVALLYGGMDEEQRERIKAEFLASPDLSPVRILLATDAASEGIDLQRHCHRLVHYEIPWNPNRLEQRNGRIDRHGQPSPEVLIHHFVSAGFEDAEPGSLDGDLEFLYAAVKKVEQIREDLGSVGPVIAQQVEEAMLGRRKTLETSSAEKQAAERKVLKIERDLRDEIAKLRERLNESIDELNITPQNAERVVRVGLQLARQPALKPATLERGGQKLPVFKLPALTGSWARCNEGLIHPVSGEVRPITFDHAVAAEHDDVVLVHLQHRLVQQSLRLLRSEIWATQEVAELKRVTARVVPDGTLDQPAVIAHGRVVITGTAGHRLHEEVIAAGGLVKDGRFKRLNVGELDSALKAATLDVPSDKAYRALVKDWKRYGDALFAAFERRARDRADSLTSQLEDRAQEDIKTITTVLNDLKATIEAGLPEVEQLQLDVFEEREQLQRDVDALKRRVEQIPQDIATETEAIERRYADPEPRIFPAAITFLIPEAMAR